MGIIKSIGLVLVVLSSKLISAIILNRVGVDSETLSTLFSYVITSGFVLAFRKDSKNLFNPIKFVEVRNLIALAFMLNVIVSMILHFFQADTLRIGGENAGFLISFLSIGILSPISEELVFRYSIFRCFKPECPRIFVIVWSSLVFAIAHLSLAKGLYALVLGLILAILYQKKSSLSHCVIFHMAFNSLSVLSVYLPFSIGILAVGLALSLNYRGGNE